MARRSRPVLCLVAVIACVLAPTASTGEIAIAAQQREHEILPEAEIDVRPCCRPRAAGVGPAPLAGVSGSVSPPEGKPVPEEEIERMREEARRRGPVGRAISEIGPIADRPAVRVGVDPGSGDGLEPGSSAPKLSGKFNGVEFGESGRLTPPDTQVAAGPQHLLQAANSVIRLTDKNGKGSVFRTAQEHWGEDPEEFLFDPKVVYDPDSGRFFLVFLLRNVDKKQSFIMLSVSRSSTPDTLDEADWCNYKIRSKKGPTWADYPGLGFNGSWLAISTNNFTFANNSFKNSYFWVIDKADVVDNAGGCPNFKTFRLRTTRDDDGVFVFNPQIAQHQTPSGLDGDPLFALNTQFLGFSDQYVLWRISDQSARQGARAKPGASLDHVTGSGYAFPPDATQRGSDKPVDAGDIRVMQQLVFADGALWTIHGSGCTFEEGGDTFGCLRVAQILPDDDGAVVGFEDLFGVPDHFLFWPGLGVDGDGDVVALFQMAGAKRRLTASYNGLKRGAARFGAIRALADEFDKVKDLTKGKCPTELPGSASATRTGDYVGVSPDPSGDGVRLAAEFAAKSGGTCGWKTAVARADY